MLVIFVLERKLKQKAKCKQVRSDMNTVVTCTVQYCTCVHLCGQHSANNVTTDHCQLVSLVFVALSFNWSIFASHESKATHTQTSNTSTIVHIHCVHRFERSPWIQWTEFQMTVTDTFGLWQYKLRFSVDTINYLLLRNWLRATVRTWDRNGAKQRFSESMKCELSGDQIAVVPAKHLDIHADIYRLKIVLITAAAAAAASAETAAQDH